MTLDWNILIANVLSAIPPTILAFCAWRSANKASTNSKEASNHAAETKDQLAKTDVSINGRVDELVRATKDKASAEATLAERERRGMSRATDIPPHELLATAEEKARLLIAEATEAAKKLIAEAHRPRSRKK